MCLLAEWQEVSRFQITKFCRSQRPNIPRLDGFLAPSSSQPPLQRTAQVPCTGRGCEASKRNPCLLQSCCQKRVHEVLGTMLGTVQDIVILLLESRKPNWYSERESDVPKPCHWQNRIYFETRSVQLQILHTSHSTKQHPLRR